MSKGKWDVRIRLSAERNKISLSYLILALRMHTPHTTQTFYRYGIQFQYLFKY